MSDTLLSSSQAARRLEVTPGRVRQLLKAGMLPCVVTPLGRLIDAEEVERLRVARMGRPSPNHRMIKCATLANTTEN